MYTYDRWDNSEKASVRVCHSFTNEKVRRVEAGIRTLAGPTESSQVQVRRPPAPSKNQRIVRAKAPVETPPSQCLEFHHQRLYSAILRCPGLT